MIERVDANAPPPGMDEEDMTARLLRFASLRAGAPPEREARVRRAVLDECCAVARMRRLRRRTAAIVAVLSTAAAVFGVVRSLSSRQGPSPAAASVATIERLDGVGAQVRSTDDFGRPVDAVLAATLHPGDRIETGASCRVALRLAKGASLRFDRGSNARLLSEHLIELDTGAVYVDGGPDAADLEIRTPFGVVRDIGTQFEIRLAATSMRVRVRSGLVEVQRGAGVSAARPGTEVTIDEGALTSRGMSPYGPEWAWAEDLAPPFRIEGRPLAAFLDHVCREQGWTLTYADATLARESSGIILHGSTDGLEPAQAVAVVISTAGLAHRLDGGELMVSRPAPR